MRRITSILVIAAGIFAGGCTGVSPVPQTAASTPVTTNPTSTPSASSTSGPMANVDGNWEFSATSSSPGAKPFPIGGSIKQYPMAGGAVHIDDPSCFDPTISRTLAGTLSADATLLTATGSDGQVVTLSGSFGGLTYDVIVGGDTYRTFTGTYKVDGGCAAGDHGTVTGQFIDSVGIPSGAWQWTGTFVDGSTQQAFHGTGQIVQNNISDPPGSFSISGNGTFDVACLSAATMKAGVYPLGSYILGTSVALELDTSSGTLNFAGTLDPDTNQISGSYTVSGSSCNQSGTAVVQIPTGCPGCWDY